MKKNIFVVIAFLAAQTSWAGTETGNGGQLWVCKSLALGIVSVELRDFKESKNFQKFYAKAKASKKKANDWIYEILQNDSRLKETISIVKQDLNRSMKDPHHRALPSCDSGDSRDYGLTLVQKVIQERKRPVDFAEVKCAYESFAKRTFDLGLGRYRYDFTTEYMKRLSEVDLAGAVIHEASWSIYLDVTEYKPVDTLTMQYWDSSDLRSFVRSLFKKVKL